MLNPNEKFEYYIALAKEAQGAGAAELCIRATADPHFHVFGELLDLPGISALSQGPFAREHRLLVLFAHGTYAQWSAEKSAYPPLSSNHILKLRTLSLLSAASGRSYVSYHDLLLNLGLSSVRELEQFVLNASYSGLISVRLDQRGERVHVSGVFGRDVIDESGLGAMRQSLMQWKAASDRFLQEMDNKIAHLGSETQRSKLSQARRELDQMSARELVRAPGYLDRGRGISAQGGTPPDAVFEQIEPDAAHPHPYGHRDKRLPSRSIRSRHET